MEQPLWRRLEQAEKAAKAKGHRRWTWCRLHHGLIDDMRWRLVARLTGTSLPLIEALIVRLEDFANVNQPRGSLEGFSLTTLAVYWDLPDERQLAAIYAALEHPDVGWIDQDHLVTFWERNPDQEDHTAAERQRRLRARRKAEKEKAAAAALEIRAADRAGLAPAAVTPLLKVRSA